jgi:hypothetical protein
MRVTPYGAKKVNLSTEVDLADLMRARQATKGSSRPILLKNSLFAMRTFGRRCNRQSIGEENGRVNAPCSLCGEAFRLSLHGWHQPLGHSPQILGYGCHQKLIVRTLQTSQAQSVEPQDAFEVSKQHLDLLAFAA